MSLLEKILNWTKKLPDWQRDAARRLFQQDGVLSEKDVDEIYGLLKNEHGISTEVHVAAIPLSREHLPALTGDSCHILLKSIHSLNNVNRLPSDQKLNFAPDGLTVIYGDNGSGKSGYARVLKRACRARDREEVLPDASQSDSDKKIPTASFDILFNGDTRALTWQHGSQATPEELASIAVFDSYCARVYLTEEQEIAYLPYGLDILENLANDLLPKLSKQIDDEINSISIDKSHLGKWNETTKVGKEIATLNPSADIKNLQLLGNITEQDKQRIREIEEILRQADPLIKANESKNIYLQLKELAEKVKKICSSLNDSVISQAKQLCQDVRDSETAVQIIAEQLRSNEALLLGTGNAAWRDLFESARRFYVQDITSDGVFPPEDSSALCPLCQNPLKDAVARLKRFDDFIKDHSSQKLSAAKQQLESEKRRIQTLPVNIEIGKILKEILTENAPSIIAEIEQLELKLAGKKEMLIDSLESLVWKEIVKIDDSAYKNIRSLAARYCCEMRIFQNAADPVKSKKISEELNELQSRQQLSNCLKQVEELILRMKNKERLQQCKVSLNTVGISRKSKEFASEFVTEEFRNAITQEFLHLGISHIKARISGKVEKGKPKHQLLLDLPTKVKMEQILSEGEQRAIALSSFLAELSLSNHKGGIVFDDPVSSLDHWRRQKVAQRLVDESKNRQVIVFTHDTVFLSELLEQSKQISVPVPVTVNYLECRGDVPGYVNDGLPWEHKSVVDRIDKLEQAQRELAKTWQTYPNEEQQSRIRSLYSKLRATIELVVEKDVFCNVVSRYRNYVNIKLLPGVVEFDQNECDQINGLFQKCCDQTDAHDSPSNRQQTVPTPSELGLDIAQLNALVKSIKDRKSRKNACQVVP